MRPDLDSVKLLFSGGVTAVEIISVVEEPIDAILLDMTLPGRSSRDVFAEARRLHSRARIILATAHPKENAERAFKGLEVDQFIRKPYIVSDVISLFQ